jgi:hypothetical protein
MLGVPLESEDAPGDSGAFEQALGRLSALGLVWTRDAAPGEPDSLIMAKALRELWKEPLSLRTRLVAFETIVENLHVDDLGSVLDALGLTAEDAAGGQRAALLAHHRDGQRVRDLVAQAPPTA